MKNKDTIKKALEAVSRSYPNRFEADTAAHRIWGHMLGDLEDELILAAVYDLCSTEDWPPTINQVRTRAAELDQGVLAPTGAYEAWERVCESLHDDTVVLTDMERSAKKRIGGSWELRNSKSAGHDRTHFIKAYEELRAKHMREMTVLPNVRELAARKAPALPSPKQRKEFPAPVNRAGPQEVKEMLTGLTGYRPARSEG